MNESRQDDVYRLEKRLFVEFYPSFSMALTADTGTTKSRPVAMKRDVQNTISSAMFRLKPVIPNHFPTDKTVNSKKYRLVGK